MLYVADSERLHVSSTRYNQSLSNLQFC